MRYIVYTPRYSTVYGGIMALHSLADLLRRSGADAYLWYDDTPLQRPHVFKRLRRAVRETAGKWTRQLRGGTRTAPATRRFEPSPYPTPIATRADLEGAIVVYPEIFDGNPLGAKRVVRWFLNKPGLLTGNVAYGTGELYFYFQEAFNDPVINPHADNKLTLVTLLDDIYQQRNFGPRSGTCYILRKGRHRVPDPTTLDGPIIDGREHREIASIFNACEYCVSYDPHTFYSTYAVLCGCRSIVVPEAGVSKDAWQPELEFHAGLAYGHEDLPYADATRDRLVALCRGMVANNQKDLDLFMRKCADFFGTPKG